MAQQRAAFCLALLLALPSAGFGAAADAGLFSADVDAAALRPPAPGLLHGGTPPRIGAHERTLSEAPLHGEGRSRTADMDFGRLAAARSEVARGRPHPLRLNLFADADFGAVIERTAPTASGYTLTGRLADDPLGTVVFAVNDRHVSGMVWSSGGIHYIRSSGRGAVVWRPDPATQGRCGVGGGPRKTGSAACSEFRRPRLIVRPTSRRGQRRFGVKNRR